jgi:hypothetical protein
VRDCEADYDVDSLVIRWLDGSPLKDADWIARCRYHGAHVGGDAAALEASIGEARRFLASVFS